MAKLRYDPSDIVAVDPSEGGSYIVSMTDIDGKHTVTLRRHNTALSADAHAAQVKSVLATWLGV